MALRNVVHRRNHKERSQPGSRKRLGLLEKHKDYVERAKDHHSKQDRIKRLQQKAALRNADEFNFGMIKSAPNSGDALLSIKRRGTRIQRRADSSMENDVVAILKSQDLGYVRNALRSEDKKIEALCQQIRPSLAFMTDDWLHEKEGRAHILSRQGLLDDQHSTGGRLGTAGKKTVWVDSIDEAKSYSSAISAKGKSPAYEYALDDDDDDDELSDNADLEQEASSSHQDKAPKRLGKLVAELASRQTRRDALDEARQKLETVRSLMTTKGTSVKKSNIARLQDAVGRGGGITANGLALPGNEDDSDDDEEEQGGRKKERIVWKWGRERKR